VDIKTIQELIGHSSASTTYDIYGHLIPGKKKEAIQLLSAAFGSVGRRLQKK
jgi:integrase